MEQHLTHFTEHKSAEGILFHKKVYLPKTLKSDAEDFILKMDTTDVFLSKHATDIIKKSEDGISRRFSINNVWNAIDFAIDRILDGKEVDIFEIGVKKDLYLKDKTKEVCKVGFRCPLDMDRDICLIVGTDEDSDRIKVITLYINLKDDEHEDGFKPERYVQPPKKVTIKIKK